MFRKILYLFQRNPCKNCLVKPCCNDECEGYIAWERPHVVLQSILYSFVILPLFIVYLVVMVLDHFFRSFVYVVNLPKTLKGGSRDV